MSSSDAKYYNGICVTCMRRKRCNLAKEKLDLNKCNAYKVHKLRKTKEEHNDRG